MITRKEYMSKKATYKQYYKQFVTGPVLCIVKDQLGNQILKSTDSNFNDIPLAKWDQVAAIIKPYAIGLLAKANEGGVSQSDLVCTAKMAAQIYKDTKQTFEQTEEENESIKPGM
jgi:hypothetical protein